MMGQNITNENGRNNQVAVKKVYNFFPFLPFFLIFFLFFRDQLFPSPGVTEIFNNYKSYFHSLSCTHTLSRSPFQATLLHLRRFEGVGGSQGFFARCFFPTAECGIARTLQGTLCQLSLKLAKEWERICILPKQGQIFTPSLSAEQCLIE